MRARAAPMPASRVHLDTEYYANMDDLPQEEVFRLTYCRDHILNALLNHRLAWPFINPIATQYLVCSEQLLCGMSTCACSLY
jgi:hypothetical protein